LAPTLAETLRKKTGGNFNVAAEYNRSRTVAQLKFLFIGFPLLTLIGQSMLINLIFVHDFVYNEDAMINKYAARLIGPSLNS
jgi:hypothetical protein